MTTMKRIQSHRDLLVWQKAMDFIDYIYEISRKFPRHERFGLWGQITRSAVSVAANITEGHARFTRKDFAYFLVLSRSSLMETDTLLHVARRQGYITDADANAGFARIVEISKMLISLRRKLIGDWQSTITTKSPTPEDPH
jgi:four helix bundle protein